LAEWLRPTALRGANHRLTAADRSDRAVETAESQMPAALPAAMVTAAPVAALPPSDEPSKQTRGVVKTETWMGLLTDSMTAESAEFQRF